MINPLPKLIILFLLGILLGTNISNDLEVYSNFTYVEAINSPIFIKNTTLADTIIEVNDEFNIKLYILADKIIQCESGWSHTAKNPNSSAYGLGQFLNQTWDYIQNKWGLELDRNNKGHQLYATIRLLNEEGTRHWNETRECWSK